MPIVYSELRRMAQHYLSNERTDHTLQSTALVHEAYVRLTGQDLPHWQNRAHFFAVSAQLMRQILVDYARSHPANGNAALRTLRRMLGKTTEWGILQAPPRIKLFREQGREIIIGAQTEAKLLAAAKQPLRDVIVIMQDTGMLHRTFSGSAGST